MFRKLFITLLIAVVPVPFCGAQSKPSFEVATIRSSNAPPTEGYWSPPGTGKFIAHNLSLALLIHLAFGTDNRQIVNKPSWLESDRFDITAKPSEGVALSRDELKPRLQSLLQQRFHLVTQTESRPVPGYALTIVKGGPKLQPTKGSPFPNFRVNVNDSELNGLNWTMPFLATMLQQPAGRPVVDKTGLDGSYDIKVDFSSDTSTDTSLPSIFTALRETLGLKLEPQSVPAEFLVIDNVDRIPTEN